MKSFLLSIFLSFSLFTSAQHQTDKTQIEVTLNNYIDGFYQGDTLKLKAALISICPSQTEFNTYHKETTQASLLLKLATLKIRTDIFKHLE